MQRLEKNLKTILVNERQHLKEAIHLRILIGNKLYGQLENGVIQ